MPITIDVPPIHCALCRAALVRAVEQAGAVVIGAALGASSLVVDTADDPPPDGLLDALRAAVASVAHPTSTTPPTPPMTTAT